MAQVNLAVFGDIHGKQNLMYRTAKKWEEKHNASIDAILQIGDFETIRTEKYHKISDFSSYYRGEKEAPYLTVFIGGNHEAWNVLAPHENGGFIAPNMYYLGRVGKIDIKGVNVAGITGIFSPNNYWRKRDSEPSWKWKYYNEEDVQKLTGMEMDVLLLHDWIQPLTGLEINQIENAPETADEMQVTPLYRLVKEKQPRFVFMGHRHKSFLESKMDETTIFGLKELREGKNGHSFRLISFNE